MEKDGADLHWRIIQISLNSEFLVKSISRFKHFIDTNQFIRIKINIEGWRNHETGRLGDPRIQFINFEMLHDVLSNNSKKITLQVDIHQLDSEKY